MHYFVNYSFHLQLADNFGIVFSIVAKFFTRDSRYAKRVLAVAEASVCLSVRHTLQLFQNGASYRIMKSLCRLP